MSYRRLALSLLLDTADDITGVMRSGLQVIGQRDTTKGEGKRLKDNALNFLFSEESESYCDFWCLVAGEPIERVRDKFRKHLSA